MLGLQERRKEVEFRFKNYRSIVLEIASIFIVCPSNICYKTVLCESVEMLVNVCICMLLECLFFG